MADIINPTKVAAEEAEVEAVAVAVAAVTAGGPGPEREEAARARPGTEDREDIKHVSSKQHSSPCGIRA